MTFVNRRHPIAILTTLLVGWLLACPALAQTEQQTAYYATEIWTGREVVKDGVILVRNGIIEAVGPTDQVSVPATATKRELGNRIVIPGLIAAHTTIGSVAPEDRTLTPQFQSVDGFDFFADQSDYLKAGITVAQVSPAAGRLMPGTGGVVQLAGDLLDRILRERESLRIVLSEESRQPPRIYEPPVGPVSEDRPLEVTRPQVASLPASLALLRTVFEQAKSGDNDDEMIAAVASAIEQKLPIRVSAKTAAEIRGALELARNNNLKLILVDCENLEPFASEFENWQDVVAGVVLSASTPEKITNPNIDSVDEEVSPWGQVKPLMDAGISVSIRANSDGELKDLMYLAGQFQQGGITRQQALQALTTNAAKMMGLGDQVGSLKAGCRANFVVLTERPFQLNCQVVETVIAGESVFQAAVDQSAMVLRAGRVYLGEGKFLDGGSVMVQGDTIRDVGATVSAPSTATVQDFGDAVIVPGYVDLGSGLGLGGPLSGTVSLSTKLGEQLYSDDPAVDYARRHGITTALLRSTSGSATPVVAFKLGRELEVVGDPVAIRFAMGNDTASAIASNERLLKAGKAYHDSWIKYEKDLAEYETKKAAAEKEAAAKKPEAKKDDAKAASDDKAKSESKPDKAEEKKDKDDNESEKPGEKPSGDKPKPEDKDQDKDKEKKPKPLPDPITGTWEGEIDFERIPAQLRAIKMELELEQEAVSGTLEFFRQEIEIQSGSYNRESRELTISFSRRDTEVTISGKLNAEGAFEGNMPVPRVGEVPVKATRTVDKSKKPEPEDKKEPEEKDKPKKDPEDKPDKEQDKPEKKDEDGKQEKESGKGEDDKKEQASDDKSKTEEEKPAEKKEELKPPKKPKTNAAMEPYRALFSGKIPAMVSVNSLYSIKEAAELFSKKYQLKTILVGVKDLARQPDLLADYDVSVVAGPDLSVTLQDQPPTFLPQTMATAGLRFGFQSNGTTGSAKLPGAVQYVISKGLSATDALDGLTGNAADMLFEKPTFGKIAAGKDADLIVLSGPPFEFSTRILAVMINGQWVYQGEE